ncbi:Twinkle-like protein [Forsythia ovata]|uniref:Twinkle-like protein n=1 Tax=Forsythia ovata TaxID=205694 RepID=A0ABD1R7Z5_9LAMI
MDKPLSKMTFEMPPHTRLRPTPSPPPSHFIPTRTSKILSLDHPNLLLASSSKPIFRISLPKNRFHSISHARLSKPTEVIVDVENEEEEETSDLAKLKQKVEALGIKSDSCIPGLYDHLICPKCKGGRSMEKSLSFHISQNWKFAMWRCFRLECGWAGQVFADNRKYFPGVRQHAKINFSRSLTEKSLRLEPLGDELLTYFAERMISNKTLEKNYVMQVAGDRKIIAFTYRRNGLLVGCKYRTVDKKFWQEKGTEKIFYGLDDIADADEIIIVEGEIDKLSMEEAGFLNCVSVPDGAPQTVSLTELPSSEKDSRFQYLWNCKDYLDKVSRIILATDGDIPGQALAEELTSSPWKRKMLASELAEER